TWRKAATQDTKASDDVPSITAADIPAARAALLAAMDGSYSKKAQEHVVAAEPKGQAGGARNCWEVSFPLPRSGVSLGREFRVARRMVAAKLTELHMLEASAGTWPEGFRPAKLLALYDAEG